MHVALVLSNAQNEYDRMAAQERPGLLHAARPGEHAWAGLASALHADTGHISRTSARPDDTDNGPKLLREGTAGGPQCGSISITNAVAFPVLIDSALNGVEAQFTS